MMSYYDDRQVWWAEAAPGAAAPGDVWWAEVLIPKCAAEVLLDPGRFAALCWFCQSFRNLEWDGAPAGAGAPTSGAGAPTSAGATLVRVFCRGCCGRLGALAPPCACGRPRYVGPLGEVSRACRACHQLGKRQDRAARRTRDRKAKKGPPPARQT